MSDDKKWAVIVPTCREQKFLEFLEAWTPLFEKYQVTLYVVEDSPEKTIKIPEKNFNIQHFAHSTIDAHLGKFSWIIPRKTGSIRSYGFLRAYQDKYDYYLTLDDDVMPREDTFASDIFLFYGRGFEFKYCISGYLDVGSYFGLKEPMRGYPFKHRRKYNCTVQYGGWDNVPDFDAITQSQTQKLDKYVFSSDIVAVPTHMGFTGCIMNTAFTHETLPMAYQLIMGLEKYGFDRWDDMWSGLFIKRICDHLKQAVVLNGYASVVHTRASDTTSNLMKEAGGYGINENLWDKLLTVELTGKTVKECYRELAVAMEPEWFGNPEYGQLLSCAMLHWIQILDSEPGVIAHD